MQRLLQVDDDLAAVGKHQRHHAAGALVVDIGQVGIVDAVTVGLDRFEQRFGVVHEFRVGHYNFTMLRVFQILVSAIVLALNAVSLVGCGQQGALYLPTAPVAAHRATLPEIVLRTGPASPAASSPVAPVTPPLSAPQ